MERRTAGELASGVVPDEYSGRQPTHHLTTDALLDDKGIGGRGTNSRATRGFETWELIPGRLAVRRPKVGHRLIAGPIVVPSVHINWSTFPISPIGTQFGHTVKPLDISQLYLFRNAILCRT
jgi:hypothetical protein